MKIEINHEACIGCGICRNIDPENLDFDDAGYMKVINQNITEQTIEAKNICPVNAISITNDEK